MPCFKHKLGELVYSPTFGMGFIVGMEEVTIGYDEQKINYYDVEYLHHGVTRDYPETGIDIAKEGLLHALEIGASYDGA